MKNYKLTNDRKKRGKILVAVIFSLMVCVLLFSGCTLRSKPIGWSGIAVTDDALFVVSVDGTLVGLNKSDGQPLWPEYPLESSEGDIAIYGVPVIYGDLIYISSYDGRIYTVIISSGYRGFIYPGKGSLEPIVGGLTISNGKVLFGCDDGNVYALNADDLTEEWTFQTGGKVWSIPLAEGNTVYASSLNNKIYALDYTQGTEKWHFEADGAFVSTPLMSGDSIYAGCFDRHVYAIDATSGILKWRSESEANKWFWAQPLIYDGVIYAPNLDGMVYIIDAETGREVAQPVELDSPIISSPVLVNDRIIIASQEGQVYSLDTTSNRTGSPIYRVDENEEIHAPLVSSRGVVYIHAQSSDEDTLYAVDIETRQEVWAPVPLS